MSAVERGRGSTGWGRAYAVLIAAVIVAVAPIPSRGLEHRGPAAGSELAPDTIDIKQVTVASGASGRFHPAEIHARRGDILHFGTDGLAAHNVSFPAALNPDHQALPLPGRYLTSPGQKWEMVVKLDPGTYHFQCDPHAPLGEVGTLVVDP